MILQTAKMAWDSVCANKLRSFLTMLGIIIGVVALVVLISIADGAMNSVTGQISEIGANYFTVTISDDKENPLRISEFNELLEQEDLEAAAPVSSTSVTAKKGYTSDSMSLTGTTGSYFEIMNLEIAYGRNLKQTDIDNSSYVVVLTADTAIELVGRTDAVGEEISLDGRPFLIVGVLEEDSSSSGGMGSSSQDDTAVNLEGYIPYSTMTRISDGVLDITQFYVSSVSEESMDKAEMTLEQILLERFGQDEEAFTIVSQSAVMEAMEEVTGTLTLMLGGIAGISLLVGGIGIMNIMLVSVTERTREIGIRKAIGAGRGSILFQFLTEAVMVSLMGCGIGIVLAAVILKIVEQLMGNAISFSISPQVAWFSVGFSALVGVVFGLYPANKAAKKKPIDALRYSG